MPWHPRRNEIEDGIQAEIVGLLKVAAIDSLIWFSVPNGGKRDWRTARKLKDTGAKAGVTDLVLVRPSDAKAFFLEVKTEDGKLSKEQCQFRDACRSLGCPWAVVKSRDEAQDVLAEWGLLRITSVARRDAA
jgi:hypothetical protein